MVTANSLVYNFFLKKNGLNSGSKSDYFIKEIVEFINEAWWILYENNVDSAEMHQRFERNIRQMKETGVELPTTIKGKEVFSTYPKNLYKRLNQKVIVSCKDCGKEKKELPIEIVESDHINTYGLNPYKDSSYGWERIIGKIGKEGIILYPSSNMKVDKILIDYYRKPSGISADALVECASSVDELGNESTKTIDFEVDNTYIARKVVDVAVLLSDVAEGKVSDFQLEFSKIQGLDNLK